METLTDADQLARTAGGRETSRSLPPREFSLVLTGDTSFGENYQAREEARGRENILKRHGYAYTMAKVAPILTESSLVIANLETVVTDIAQSPFADSKGWVHWSDVRETPRQLLAHNIRAVSLANNHSIDYGVAGLKQTVETLSAAGIASFGAGLNLAEARLPFSHEAEILMPAAGKRPHLRCFAAFAVDDKYETSYQAYATAERPGTNPLALADLARDVKLAKSLDPDAFIVAILHWRRDYRWRSQQQKEAARALLAAGSDLVIGHGSHMMQQIEKIEGRWVAHGLGNFVFNSPGRYEAMGVPPYSLVARLVFADGARPRHMRLYPLFTNNRATGYQTRFVTDDEFHEVYALLLERSPEPKDFQAEIATGSDRFGRHLEVPLA
jgi:poly-gamma-glutamate capsule biosynthesis protein CapA/YwtB (metallophosphatase superfamily)